MDPEGESSKICLVWLKQMHYYSRVTGDGSVN
jgi:hypothetical protein